MKFIAAFGLVGLLSTIAIIFWLAGEQAESLTPSEDGVDKKADRIMKQIEEIDKKASEKGSNLPKP